MSQSQVERAISKARVALILDQPWFGSLVLKLRVRDGKDAGEPVHTMATDGTNLFYNTDWVSKLPEVQLRGVLAHEVLHCALLHPYRRGNRDPRTWNIACDEAINEQLITAGFTLPQNRIDGPIQRKGMTAEARYTLIQAEQSEKGKGKPGEGDGKGDGWNWGGVMDPPKSPAKDPQKDSQDDANGKGGEKGKGKGDKASDGQGNGQGTPSQSDGNMTETDWQIAASQAEKIASAAGKLPGGIAAELRRARETKQDWRAILRRFITSTVPIDYSWSRPNRRFIGQGLYLPGIHKEGVGELVIAVDTSGSVSGAMLDQFAAEIARIQSESRPEKIHVIYCDTRVFKVAEFGPDEEFEFEKGVARGGTNFCPVFAHVAENDIRPRALIYCTDLEPGDRPEQPGEYPVLWVVPETCRRKDWEWGEVVEVSMDHGEGERGR